MLHARPTDFLHMIARKRTVNIYYGVPRYATLQILLNSLHGSDVNSEFRKQKMQRGILKF
jgi:hypothetical protein